VTRRKSSQSAARFRVAAPTARTTRSRLRLRRAPTMLPARPGG
jgi:hypothetical protein